MPGSYVCSSSISLYLLLGWPTNILFQVESYLRNGVIPSVRWGGQILLSTSGLSSNGMLITDDLL